MDNKLQDSAEILTTLLDKQVTTSDSLQSEIFEKISAKKVQQLHNMAYVYYQNQRYREADAMFRLLVSINPDSIQYWKGLGACLQLKKNYEHALLCYQRVQSLLNKENDPYLYVHIADCYFAMKQIEKGFKALEFAKKHAKKTDNKKILDHVSFMHERWKNVKSLIS